MNEVRAGDQSQPLIITYQKSLFFEAFVLLLLFFSCLALLKWKEGGAGHERMNVHTHTNKSKEPGEEGRRKRRRSRRRRGRRWKQEEGRKKKRTVACAHDLRHLVRLFFPLAKSLRSFNTREEKQKYNSITYPKCQQQPLKNNFAICSTGKTRIRKRVAQALSCCCYWKKIDGREIRVREWQWRWWKKRHDTLWAENTSHQQCICSQTLLKRAVEAAGVSTRLTETQTPASAAVSTDWLTETVQLKHTGKEKKNKSKKETRWRVCVCAAAHTRGAQWERKRWRRAYWPSKSCYMCLAASLHTRASVNA